MNSAAKRLQLKYGENRVRIFPVPKPVVVSQRISSRCKPTVLKVNGRWRLYTKPKQFKCYSSWQEAIRMALMTCRDRYRAATNPRTKEYREAQKYGPKIFPSVLSRLKGRV